jgi:16S rRNA (uracil1498-N3)-methyltransferase
MTTAEYKNLPRLYLAEAEPAAGEVYALSEKHLHYLKNVMRKSPGDQLRVFNGKDGEWLSEIKELNKKNGFISFAEKVAEQKNARDILIICSNIKKEALELSIEKLCELGAAAFQPIVCARTVVHRVNEERLHSISIEAAEQSERLDVMQVRPMIDLKSALKSLDKDRALIFCLERSEASPLLDALQSGQVKPPLAILIGPEGGFTEEEAELILAAHEKSIPVSLGKNILRAETALISALATVQAFNEIKQIKT